MKRILICFFPVLFIFACLLSCGADEIYDAQSDALGTEEVEGLLPDDAKTILDDYTISEGISLDSGLGKLLEGSKQQIGGIVKNSLRSASLLLVIVLACGIVQSLYDSSGSSSMPNYIPLAGALAISAAVSADLTSLIGQGREIIDNLDAFSKGLLGTLAAASSALGQPASSAAKYMATIMFSDVLITLINRVILPIVYAYIATVTANAALGENILAKLASFLKWVCVSLLGLILTAFTTYLALTGIIAGSADAVTLKTTKMILSNAIPVVGKILSDASETVLASAKILRNSVGVFGMISVLAMCIVPFLRLGIQYLIFKLTGAISSPMSDSRLSKLIDDLAGAFGLILGMLGSCAILILISIVSAISVVG
jgi:stage III sporulation protein AE